MEEFYDHMQNGQEDKIRMVQYTIEGYPVVKDILYNGEELTVTDARQI
ncbi:DUF4362 domain-containing protein [Bacillus coahuilensis]|nr:DUF4362 domain-containing protein [Bacillus coahuilensis]